jgi:hypothetical protein
VGRAFRTIALANLGFDDAQQYVKQRADGLRLLLVANRKPFGPDFDSVIWWSPRALSASPWGYTARVCWPLKEKSAGAEMKALLVQVAAIATGPALLLAWSVGYAGSCWALAIPMAVTLVLVLGLRERSMKRRRCAADCWFIKGTLLHRVLCSPWIVTLMALVVSAGLSGVLMVNIPSLGFAQLTVLAVDAPLVAVLYALFRRAAGGIFGVNATFRGLFARNWTIAVNVLLLLPALIVVQLEQPPPDWIDPAMKLEATLRVASGRVGSECPSINQVVGLQREAEALTWWLVITGTSAIEDRTLRWVAWLLFLVSGTLSLWAYSGLCVQLVHLAQCPEEGQ